MFLFIYTVNVFVHLNNNNLIIPNIIIILILHGALCFWVDPNSTSKQKKKKTQTNK